MPSSVQSNCDAHDTIANGQAVGSVVVRASDSRPEGLGSMPDATKHPPSTHGFTCRNCGGGDRGRVAIYRPFGEFRRAKSYFHLYGAQGQANDRRTSCPCHDEFRGPRSDYVRQRKRGGLLRSDYASLSLSVEAEVSRYSSVQLSVRVCSSQGGCHSTRDKEMAMKI
ncbi:uncharacterized protein TNCV_10011 [Trichonephila clavipes]|nr:uncharacterized protein TNCV_10011 [Trichonephila clavipes]